MPSPAPAAVFSLWPWRLAPLLRLYRSCNAKPPYRYPLITLSTRAQVESKRAHSSTYDAVRRIVQREGVTGLYSGLDSALFGISITNFVYYYCNWLSMFLRGAHIVSKSPANNFIIQGMSGPVPSSSVRPSAAPVHLRSSQLSSLWSPELLPEALLFLLRTQYGLLTLEWPLVNLNPPPRTFPPPPHHSTSHHKQHQASQLWRNFWELRAPRLFSLECCLHWFWW